MKHNKQIQWTAASAAILRTVNELLDKDQPERAIDLLNRYQARDATPLRNAWGVCLLRTGRFEEAMHVFRDLYFPGNAVSAPRDTPTEIRVNYVTSLLTLGNVQIASSLLYHIPERNHPAVRRLRAAIRTWKRSQPRWKRVLSTIGLYPESPPQLGRRIGRLWFPACHDDSRSSAKAGK